MTYEYLIIEETEHFVQIQLNRADKKNALNKAMRAELLDAFSRFDGQVNTIIITGSEDAFCSGMDLSEKPGLDESDEVWEIANAIYNGKSVYIAAVNGVARGGGTTLTNACDLALASPNATFGIPEIVYGVYATVAGPTTQLAVPRKIASHMILTGKPISAAKAAEVFLINEVCASGDLLPKVHSMATDLAKMKAPALAIAKQGVNSLPIDEAMRREGQALSRRLNQPTIESRGAASDKFQF